MDKKKHITSLMISAISALVTIIGYMLVEMQHIEFESIDPLVLKTLLIGIFVRSFVKLLIESVDSMKTTLRSADTSEGSLDTKHE